MVIASRVKEKIFDISLEVNKTKKGYAINFSRIVMDEFCGNSFPFWNLSFTWYTDTPDFTPCFHKTLLIWVPCGFLWLVLPFQIYLFQTSRRYKLPWSTLNILKTIVTSLLVLMMFVDLMYMVYLYFNGNQSLDLVDYFAPLILCVTLFQVLILIQLDRIKGFQTSGILFSFWLLLLICGMFTYISLIRKMTQKEELDRLSHYIIYMIYYPLIIVEFILCCFVDKSGSYDEIGEGENPCPEQHCSFLSTLLFSWFGELAVLGFKRPLVKADLWTISPRDKTGNLLPKFEKNWAMEMEKYKQSKCKCDSDGELIKDKKEYEPSLIMALLRSFGARFFTGSFIKLICDTIAFVSPQLLNLLIAYTSDITQETWKGYFYVCLMFATALIQSLLSQWFYQLCIVAGMWAKSSLIGEVYKKALRLSSSARKHSTVGEIVNLMAVDAQRFLDTTFIFNMTLSAPLQITLAVYFLYGILGPSIFAGLAVMVLMGPLNGILAQKTRKLQVSQMKLKDERIKLMNEVLNGIKVLKLYAWESSFMEQISTIRQKELKVMKKAAYLSAVTMFIWTCAPFLVSLVTFATYVLSSDKNILTPTVAFVSLSLMNILRMPLSILPIAISYLIQIAVSIKRLQTFLKIDELDLNMVEHKLNEKNPVLIENGSFTWDKDEPTFLKNINLNVEDGKLIAIVGQVGSGKSSLLSAILGEMDKLSGRVNVRGNVAYCAQQAWIQNATVRDNILFDKQFDSIKYQKIIDACALNPDLAVLPGGDMTEIGEKGINLSGGQKQRISLARAVYNDADLYLLDDPLSAVDSHVGKHIFQNVIGPEGALRNTTRIFVTNAVTYLHKMDQIVVMLNGAISEIGSYKQLLDQNGAFAEFLRHYFIQEEEEVEELDPEDLEIREELMKRVGTPVRDRKFSTMSSKVSGQSSASSKRTDVNMRKKSLKGTTRLIQTEAMETGTVKASVYILYMKYLTIPLTIFVLILYAGSSASAVGSNIWLSEWSEDKIPGPNETLDTDLRDLRLIVYGVLGFGQGFFTFLAAIALAISSVIASRSLHYQLLDNILKAPMLFFDTTPIGRLLNRFGKDIEVVDNTIPMTTRSVLSFILQVLSTIIVICISTPLFASIIIPLALLYYFIQKFYISSSRQLKRLESVSRSPIYSHFQESLMGSATIRAYGKTDNFIEESFNRIDENQRAYYPSVISNRWLAIRLEFVGNLIVLFAALFAVISRETLDAGTVGLSISYSLSVTMYLNMMVRFLCELETNIVSVERIKEYTEIPTEASWVIPDSRPGPKWPDEGLISFKNYKCRYRAGLDLVLKGVNCEIHSNEKIGIVGRTGAGKSSFTLAIFRILEPSDGTIIIDDIDISAIGLHDLRSKISVIPQDPVLFSGVLRTNLDPFETHSDEELWLALEQAHLKDFIQSLALGLGHNISEGGENLSVGQRQLICLARALLRKNKILILDEATAAVDLETDDLIQNTIRSQFADCTILTIAHRLNTIMDSNRVMVLDKGEIKEFDSPANLLQNQSSLFYSLAKDAGLVSDKEAETFTKNLIDIDTPKGRESDT